MKPAEQMQSICHGRFGFCSTSYLVYFTCRIRMIFVASYGHPYSIGKLCGVSTYRGHLLPQRNHQYGLRLETQFSWDLEMARFEPRAAGSQSAAYLRATVLRFLVIFVQATYVSKSFNCLCWYRNSDVRILDLLDFIF